MKSFSQFVTEMQNRESPFHGNIRPSGTYPKNLPYIRQPDKEMDLFKRRFKLAKLSDNDINAPNAIIMHPAQIQFAKGFMYVLIVHLPSTCRSPKTK